MNSIARHIGYFGIMLAVTTSSLGGETSEVTGSVTYRERIALTPGTIVEIKLLDVSRQDVVAKVISEQIIEVEHQVPIPFERNGKRWIYKKSSSVTRVVVFDGNGQVSHIE